MEPEGQDLGVDGLLDFWQEAWSSGHAGDFESICTADVHYEDPLTASPLNGLEALEAHARTLRGGFPDARVEQTGERLTGGGFVAAPMRLTGTQTGEIAGMPASGRSLVLQAIVYFELRESRIARARAFFDLYDVALQLGLLPRSGTVGERVMLLLRGFGIRR